MVFEVALKDEQFVGLKKGNGAKKDDAKSVSVCVDGTNRKSSPDAP